MGDALRLALQLAKRLDADLDRRLAAAQQRTVFPGDGTAGSFAAAAGMLRAVLDGTNSMVLQGEAWAPPASARKAILRLVASGVARLKESPEYWYNFTAKYMYTRHGSNDFIHFIK